MSNQPRPGVVRSACVILGADVVLTVAGTVVVVLTNPAIGAATFPPGGPSTAQAVPASLFRLVLVLGLAVLALQVVAIVYAYRGRNWARIVLTVLAALDVLVFLSDVGRLGSGFAAGGPLAVSTGLSTAGTVLITAAVILLFCPGANAWFRSRQDVGAMPDGCPYDE